MKLTSVSHPFIHVFIYRTLSIYRVKKPSPFAASALDTFIRITGPHMLQIYGVKFIQLLQIIQNEILPKFEENPSKTCLIECVHEIIRSKGQKFKSFFKEQN